MKKFMCIVLAALMALTLLAGCGETTTPAEGTGSYKVGILQYMQHTSLDEIASAITAELNAKAAEAGVTVDIRLENAQGDQNNISAIMDQFKSDNVDLVIAIATPAAQGAAAALEGTEIPMIFSAVTDPVKAELVESMEVPGGSITGTSDAIPVEDIFKLADKLTPDVKGFGLMFCTSEVNSISVIEQVKTYLDEQNTHGYEESAVTTVADVQNVAQIALARQDAIFVPIDNTVASAMSVLAEEAIRAGKPVYVAADSMVKDGALASVGCNYTTLGNKTADMAFRVLMGENPATMPVEVLENISAVLNVATLNALGMSEADLPADVDFTFVGMEDLPEGVEFTAPVK